MRIKLGNAETTIQYDLYDEFDAATQTSSMSRTTGYTCTAALNMLMAGLFKSKGVFPPELVGNNESCFRFLLDYLARRGIHYHKTETKNRVN
ncbi:MAG TPA: saccharopine dehydrogenase C-terminal domain-containing protein, partial [Ferruginibacter sp.]|nr:saccharopine dehydrogenase C-terminal domain-containing protein [Ferruginibacter sp.]